MGKSKIMAPQPVTQKKLPSNKFVALDSDDDSEDEKDNVPNTDNVNNTKNIIVEEFVEIIKEKEPVQEIQEVQGSEQYLQLEEKYVPQFKHKNHHNRQNANQIHIVKKNNQIHQSGNHGGWQSTNDKKYDTKKKYENHSQPRNSQFKPFKPHNKYENDHKTEQSEYIEQKEFKKYSGESKKLYIEPTEYCEEKENELGNTKFLNSSWTVWIHKANVGPETEYWTEDTYTSIYVINSIGSFWRFFTNFQMLDKINYQYFIMRNKIKPIWEDNDNRNGSICSFRVEYGPSAMTCMSLLIMNETFMNKNDDINGISYSIKNKSVLIKVWYKVHNDKIVDKIPIEFMNKLDAFIKANDKFGKRDNTSITIRYNRIDPKYSLEN